MGSDGGGAKTRVLVIDDNELNRALAEATLDADGHYEVLAASNGEQGLALFAAHRPDCVLLDVRMPGLDGFAVCERIRAMPEGKDTPVLFLTALRDVDVFDRALRVGGDDFLTKPVSPAELLVRVQTALKVRRLDHELREHVQLLRQQRDELLRVQLQKERLSAFLVHDLKNPVSTIDLQAQLLLRNKQLPPNAKDAAQAIRSEARQLLRMLLNLLDLAKSEEGHLAPKREAFSIKLLFDELVQSMEARAESLQVKLRAEVTPAELQCVGEQDLLRRVFENLLDNALRHTPSEGSVVLRAEALENGSGIQCAIEDSGPGIPAAMRERIFERYVQLTPGESSPSRAGRGLGLAFCRAAIEAHGGQIWVDEGATVGTVFRFTLPVKT